MPLTWKNTAGCAFALLGRVSADSTSRSAANVLAVAERQQLEGLRREQKTARNAVAAARDKLEVLQRKRAALVQQTTDLQDRDNTVSGTTRRRSSRADAKRCRPKSPR
jgi:hypothetical protein